MPVPAFIGYGARSLHSLSPQQLAHVREVGTALFEGRCLQAKHGGFIAVLNTTPTQDVKGTTNGERQELQRSAAEPWQGRQGSPGGTGESRRGSSDHSGPVLGRQRLISQASGQLREHYSGVRLWKEVGGNGVWLAVSIFPVGREGPQADFTIAVPTDPAFRILSWGFWRTDNGLVWIGPKHTNYPDGSACAFPSDSGAWTEALGLVPYVDRLAEWSMRHIFLDAEGIWPGRQEGSHVYYRLRHTHPQECCTRCRGLDRYESCGLSFDQEQYAGSDRADFISVYGADVADQRPHSRLINWNENRRGTPPTMCRIHPDMRKARGISWSSDD